MPIPAASAPKDYRWLIALSVMIATILEILDSTIVSIALPHMMGSFGATMEQITWVLTSYVVSAAVIMPLSGFLINRLGSKKLLLINIIGFLVASMLCGIALSLEQMVVCRILQGIFGASLVPLSQFILRNAFPPEQLTKAMAIWGMGIMAGPVLGPTIGGYITESLNWRWIFYINLPFCLIDIFLCLKFVPETPIKFVKTDKLGIFLMIICVACLQIFLDRGNTVNWFEAESIRWLFGMFIVGFIAFIIHSLNTPAPIINIKLFLNRNFSASCFIMAIFVAGIIGVVSIQPLFMENLMNYPPDFAGLIMAPRGIASAVTMGFVPFLSKHFGHRALIMMGIINCIIGTYLFSTLTLEASAGYFIWTGCLQGIGMGLFFVPLSTIVFTNIAEKDYGEASGVFSFCRNLGMSIGISLIGALISRASQIHWNNLGAHINYFNTAIKYHHFNLHHVSDLIHLQGQVNNQAVMLSFLNAYQAVIFSFIIILPLVLLLTRQKLLSILPAH